MKEWFLLTLGVIFCYAGGGLLPKFSTQYMSVKSVIVYQGIGVALVALLVFSNLSHNLETHPKGIILGILGGMFNFLGVVFYVQAISKGSVAIVSTLSALHPVVIIFFGLVLLHETLTLKQGIGIGFALLAIALIAT